MGAYTHPTLPAVCVQDKRTRRYHHGDSMQAIARRLYGPTATVKTPRDPARRGERIVTWTTLDGYTMTATWKVLR